MRGLRILMPLAAVVAFVVTSCGAPAATPVPTATVSRSTPPTIAAAAPTPVVSPIAASSFKSPEALIPASLAEGYPLIAKYHWSRLPRPSQAKPKYGGTLRLVLSDPNNWDPFTGNTATYSWGNMVYSNLVRPDLRLSQALQGKDNLRQLVARCDVCESWTVASPTRYVFKIRPDAHWQNTGNLNSRPLTAQDVKFSYDKYMEPKAYQQYGTFQGVESIEAPDDHTLIINTKFAHAGFVDTITHPAYYIFSKEAYEREGGLVIAPPLGSGSMTVKEWVPSARLILTRYPNYWRTDEYGQQLPYLDGISLVFMPNPQTQVAAFRTGQLDSYVAPTWDIASDLLKSEKPSSYSLHNQEPNTNGQAIAIFQLRKAPFNDIRVRRALNMAIDRPAVIRRALGEGLCTQGVIPTWWEGLDAPRSCKDLGQWYQYNPTMAKQLLKEAGFDEKNPLVIEFTSGGAGGSVTPARLADMQSDQEYFKAIGVTANIRQMETTAALNLQRSTKYEGVLFASVGTGTDLDAFAQKVYSQGPENFSGINDPELDKLVISQRSEFDLQKRRAMGAAMADRILDEAYFFPTIGAYHPDFRRPYLQNWVSHDLYSYIQAWGATAIEYVWMDK